jgi:transposase
MNSWSFRELQRQVAYKTQWEGLPVIHVPPYGTSAKCSICGSKLIPEQNRLLRCPAHGEVDRDVNAAKNILAKGVRFAPVASPCEAMVVSLQQGAKSMEMR